MCLATILLLLPFYDGYSFFIFEKINDIFSILRPIK